MINRLSRLLGGAAVAILLATIAVGLVPVSAHAASISVPTDAGATVAAQLTDRATSTWPWYLTRASGLVAAGLLVILLLSGIGQITGLAFRFMEPINAWATHRAVGLSFGVAVIAHIASLLFDNFAPFTITAVLLPFASGYKPVTIAGVHLGSLWVALGVVAFYLVLAIVISSLLWIEKKPYTWRFLHYLSYLVVIFVFIHALYLGTDLAHGIWRYLWVISGVSVAIAVLHRLRRSGTV